MYGRNEAGCPVLHVQQPRHTILPNDSTYGMGGAISNVLIQLMYDLTSQSKWLGLVSLGELIAQVTMA